MFFITFVFKLYMIVLMFRLVTTTQEARFNPIGKSVAMLTSPIFNILKIKDGQIKQAVPLLIISLILINALLEVLFYKISFISALLTQAVNYLTFFMFFFIVCIILGSFVNKILTSVYITYFFRLGMPWIKFTRMLVPISSGNIIYPAMLSVFIVYLVLTFGIAVIPEIYNGVDVSLVGGEMANYFLMSLKQGLFSLTDLIFYAGWAVIIRALLSWLSPDLRNPFVQLIYVLTEPIISFFRRFIPPIGMIDISAIVAIVFLNVLARVLQSLISMI